MTLIGKLLVFVVLVLGIGMAVTATSLYSQPTSWFSPPPDGGVDRGHSPLGFTQLAAETETLGKAAAAASGAWGGQYRALEAAEAFRADRHIKMFGTLPDGTPFKSKDIAEVKGLIGYAKTGHPTAPGGAAFFQLKEEANGKYLDLGTYTQGTGDLDPKSLGGPVLAQDAANPNSNTLVPLTGSETLSDRYNTDAAAVRDMALEIAKLRKEQKGLADQVAVADAQVIKQRSIRDNLIDEASYLSSLEVNVTEQRETAVRRRKQLRDRLAPFGGP